MVSALDDAVANVTAALRRHSLYRDTVIVFLSDNGGAERGSNWPLRGKKNSVYEGGTRTVAFLHSPRLKKAALKRSETGNEGSVARGLVHLVDWYPTLLSLAGGDCLSGSGGGGGASDADFNDVEEVRIEN